MQGFGFRAWGVGFRVQGPNSAQHPNRILIKQALLRGRGCLSEKLRVFVSRVGAGGGGGEEVQALTG